MGIPRRRLNLRVSKQFADHRQPFADEQSARRERVAEIVNAYIVQTGSLTNAAPWMLQVCQMRILFLSHDHVRIVVHARQRLQQRHGGIAEMNSLRARLAIGQPQFLLL